MRYTLLFASLIMGCGSADLASLSGTQAESAVKRCDLDPRLCFEVSPEPAHDEACPGNRLVALLSADYKTCPPGRRSDDGYWRASPLVSSAQGNGVPAILARYCVYTWETPTGVAPDESLLPGSQYFEMQPEADCQVMAPFASAAVDAIWPTLEKAFYWQVEAVEQLPRGAKVPPRPTRVAVLDTSPTIYDYGRPVDGRSGHAMAVGSIARRLGCSDPSRRVPLDPALSCENRCGATAGACRCDASCAARRDCCVDYNSVCLDKQGACIAQIASELALPLVSAGKPDRDHGGFFGTQSNLTAAIYAAIDSWSTTTASQPHLVINLSLGWDPQATGTGGKEAPSWTPAEKSVWAALVHASCMGAAVVVAAGNDPGGPKPSGPTYPAAWEALPAPTTQECERYEVGTRWQAGQNPSRTRYTPLVFSVGGLMGDDRPLPVGRPQGMPRLAAPAAFAVTARYDSRSTPTAVLTGTSISAAVVSGIAATVWGYRPDLPAADVMELVWGTGEPLGMVADYALAGFAGDVVEVHRVGMCQALRAACASAGIYCPDPASLPKCTHRPARVDARPKLSAEELAAMTAPPASIYSGKEIRYAQPGIEYCDTPAHFWVKDELPGTPCPERQFYGAPIVPWTKPAPTHNPCSGCGLSMNAVPGVGTTATVYLAIDPDYPYTLTNLTLLIPGEGNYTLPEPKSLAPGQMATITDIPLNGPIDGAARLSFATPSAAGGEPTSTVVTLVGE